jgi:nitroreductase
VDTFLTIASRREVRSYAKRPVEDEVLGRVLDAGRLAGSSRNGQPWRFVLVTSRELLDQLADRVYARGNLLGAAAAILVAVEKGGKAEFDAGRAAQNMMLAAWNEGVGSCPNGMPDPAAVADLLGVDDPERPLVLISLGYPARPIDPESRTPEEWIARADRRPFDEVVERR